jgi:hypothetical protein
MRRRDPGPAAAPPAELVEFVPAVWEPRGGLDGWLTARRAWLRADGGETVDPIDWLRENVALKRRLARRAAARSSLPTGPTPPGLSCAPRRTDQSRAGSS